MVETHLLDVCVCARARMRGELVQKNKKKSIYPFINLSFLSSAKWYLCLHYQSHVRNYHPRSRWGCLQRSTPLGGTRKTISWRLSDERYNNNQHDLIFGCGISTGLQGISQRPDNRFSTSRTLPTSPESNPSTSPATFDHRQTETDHSHSYFTRQLHFTSRRLEE